MIGLAKFIRFMLVCGLLVLIIPSCQRNQAFNSKGAPLFPHGFDWDEYDTIEDSVSSFKISFFKSEGNIHTPINSAYLGFKKLAEGSSYQYGLIKSDSTLKLSPGEYYFEVSSGRNRTFTIDKLRIIKGRSYNVNFFIRKNRDIIRYHTDYPN